MSPNDTSGLDKRSWRRAKPFLNDLEYIELELEWIKARCDWFDRKNRTRPQTQSSRRRWMDEDDSMSRDQLRQQVKEKKAVELKLRRSINCRLQAHRASPHPRLRLDELSMKCELNDLHRTILILALSPCFSKEFNDCFEHVGDRYSSLSVDTIFAFFEFTFYERIEHRVVFSSASPLVRDELLDLDFRRRYEGARDLLDATIEIDNRTFSYLIERREGASSHVRSMVNLLLSLIERHSGLVLLATNHRELLDAALERRVTHQVHLKRPDETTRLRLWAQMLPRESPGAAEVDIKMLATNYAVSGAEIRVAILRAATMAASREILLSHDLIERELQSMSSAKTKRAPIGFSRRIS